MTRGATLIHRETLPPAGYRHIPRPSRCRYVAEYSGLNPLTAPSVDHCDIPHSTGLSAPPALCRRVAYFYFHITGLMDEYSVSVMLAQIFGDCQQVFREKAPRPAIFVIRYKRVDENIEKIEYYFARRGIHFSLTQL